MNIKNQIKMTFLSVPENVGVARVAVAAFAAQLDFNLDDLEEIKVAVSEAVSNCIIHGYQNDPNMSVEVICSIVDEQLEISVIDKGKGIANLEQAMQPTYSSESSRMGLGFTFMQSFMDQLDVNSNLDEGTTVLMHKKPSVLSMMENHNN